MNFKDPIGIIELGNIKIKCLIFKINNNKAEILSISKGMLPIFTEMLPISTEMWSISTEMLPISTAMLPISTEMWPISTGNSYINMYIMLLSSINTVIMTVNQHLKIHKPT